MRRVLPHPVVSALILAVWLALYSSGDPVVLVGGGVLAWLVPLALHRSLQGAARLRRPWTAVRLTGIVLWDIVTSNLAVARAVLGPGGRLGSGFIDVPVELTHPDATALLASIIAITPGTVVADVDPAGDRIRVHVLDLEDPSALISYIKHRYERPLRDIFEC